MHEYDRTPADVGLLGVLSSRTHYAVRTYIPLCCYTAAVVCYFVLLHPPLLLVPWYDTLACFMVSCAVAGTTLRRTAELLWTEPGKLTYLRVSAINAQLVPDTVRGQVNLYTLLVHFFCLPLCILFAAFHKIMPMSILGSVFFPPKASTVVPLLVLFAVMAMLSITATIGFYCIVIALDRCDPFLFDHSSLPRVGALAATALTLPALSLTAAVLPCDGEYMRCAGNVRCASTTHRISTAVAAPVLALLGALMEAATASTRLMGDVSGGAHYGEEPRCDLLLWECLLAFRWVIVLTAVFATTAPGYIVAVASSYLMLWLTLKHYSSSVAVLCDLFVGVVVQSTVASTLTLALLVLTTLDHWVTAVVWLTVWLSATGMFIAFYVKRRGNALVDYRSSAVIILAMGEPEES